MKRIIFSICFLSLFVSVYTQSDEINISAAFNQSIELQIVGNANCSFTFSSVNHYKNGFAANSNHGSNHIQFQVESSTNFQVDMTNTDFTDGDGNILDSRFFHVRLMNLNNVSQIGSRFTFSPGNGFSIPANGSDAYILDKATKTLILPGPNGNAGNFEENHFQIRIGVGIAGILKKNNLPNMLDANITPGTYTSVLTLTAVPVIL
ncbi:MAG: hypothetical protein AAF824_24875 [Bacteroidota bacterium]